MYHKLALTTQDEDHNITASYRLTIPKFIVPSPNFKIQGDTGKGDVFVEAQDFSLDKTATIDENFIFTNEDVKSSAIIDDKVTGSIEDFYYKKSEFIMLINSQNIHMRYLY